jgi:hypothetical protein
MDFRLFFLHKIIKDGKPGSGWQGQEKGALQKVMNRRLTGSMTEVTRGQRQ